MSVLSTSALTTDINNSIFQNTTRQITGNVLNGVLINIKDSMINRITDANLLGLRDFDASRAYAFGEGVFYSGQLYRCSNISGHSGAWNAANFTVISGGGGGSATWGGITGTLSDQTDLQTALNGKVSLAGGSMDIDAFLLFESTGGETVEIIGNQIHLVAASSQLYITQTGFALNNFSFTTTLGFEAPTANRNLLFPNKSGTLAVTSDIPSISGLLSNTLTSANIFVGNGSNVATGVSLTLSGAGGSFSLSNTGVLTFPNADAGTRGLLTVTDWNTFNGKQNALVSGTNIQSINGASILASGNLNLFAQGGNSYGVAASIGTNDAFNLEFRTNNAVRGRFLTAANTGNVDSTLEITALGTGSAVINAVGNQLGLSRSGTRLWNFNGTRNLDMIGGNWQLNTTAGSYSLLSNTSLTLQTTNGNIINNVGSNQNFIVQRAGTASLTINNVSATYTLGGNSGSWTNPFDFNTLSHTNIPISSESVICSFLSSSVQYNNSGTLSLNRTYSFGRQTITSTIATFTITTAATFAIGNSPLASTNVAITDALAFLVQAGRSKFVGEVSIGLAAGTVQNASALLELTSTTKGLLLPRMTTAQRTAMANVGGMMVYDTDLLQFFGNNGTTWNLLG